MSKAFMNGTRFKEVEQMMTAVPNFSPRRNGVIIMALKVVNEKEEYKKCIYCTEYAKGGCTANHCPYLLERASFGQVGYKDFLKDCFCELKNYRFDKRLMQLAKSFKGDWFISPHHRERFLHYKENSFIPCGNNNQYIATLYLLTANEDLWNRAKDAIGREKIDFTQIMLKGIDTVSYALYQAAKTIYTGKRHIEVQELADETLIDNNSFKIIINSFLIARFGGDVLSIKP